MITHSIRMRKVPAHLRLTYLLLLINTVALDRAVAEASGDIFVPAGERRWVYSADGIICAWRELCYAATKEKFDQLWDLLCKEFSSQKSILPRS